MFRPRQQPADRRSEDEAEADGGAHHAHVAGALGRRHPVGHIGVRRRHVGVAHAADDPRGEHHPQGLGEAERQHRRHAAGDRDEHHRAAAMAVAQAAEHRRHHELRRRVAGRQQRHHPCRRPEVGRIKRQHRDHDAERHQVEEQREPHRRERPRVPGRALATGRRRQRWEQRRARSRAAASVTPPGLACRSRPPAPPRSGERRVKAEEAAQRSACPARRTAPRTCAAGPAQRVCASRPPVAAGRGPPRARPGSSAAAGRPAPRRTGAPAGGPERPPARPASSLRASPRAPRSGQPLDPPEVGIDAVEISEGLEQGDRRLADRRHAHPGMLSEVSPVRAIASTTLVGSTPMRWRTPASSQRPPVFGSSSTDRRRRRRGPAGTRPCRR